MNAKTHSPAMSACLVLALALTACGGSGGENGGGGLASPVAVTDVPPDPDCANDGTRVEAGGDLNAAGVLDIGDACAHGELAVGFEAGLVTLRAVEEPLGDVLRRLGDAAGFETVVEGDTDRPITLDLREVTIEHALRQFASSGSLLLEEYATSANGRKPRLRSVTLWVPGERAAPSVTSPVSADLPATTIGPKSVVGSAGVVGEPTAHRAPPPPDDDASRHAFVDGLLGMRDPLTVRLLGRELQKDASPAVRLRAVSRLGEIGTPSAMEVLEGGLGDGDAGVRSAILRQLARRQGRPTVLLLGQMIYSDPDPVVRNTAADLLADREDPVAGHFLADAARQGDLIPESN